MREITNTSLAMFIISAIVISTLGTILSINKLAHLESEGISGMLSTNTSGTAYANLSVPAAAYINITDTYIQLGTLDIGATNTSQATSDWWSLRNDGSVNISIRIYSTSSDDQNGNGTATVGRGPFSSTTTSTGCLSAFTESATNRTAKGACFLVACLNTSFTGAACNRTYDALPTNALGSGSRFIIVNLSPDSNNDTANLGANVTVPEAEPPGNKEQDVVFLASQST